MSIRACIAQSCTEVSTDSTQLCPEHLRAHVERCRAIQQHRDDEVSEQIMLASRLAEDYAGGNA